MPFCFAVVVGLYLGLTYRYFVLIPGTLICGVACSVYALVDGYGLSDILVLSLVPSVGLQVGYVLGLCSFDLAGKILRKRWLGTAKMR